MESDFTGSNPSQNTPWDQTSTLDENATFGGWTLGAGLRDLALNNVFGFWGIFNGDPRPLEEAIANDEYLSFTIQPNAGYELDLRGAEMSLTMERIGYHSPRRYVVVSSVNGFDVSEPLFDSGQTTSQTPQEFEFVLPFDGYLTNQMIEFRVYVAEGQWASHHASLNGFRLYGAAVLPDPTVPATELEIIRGDVADGGLLNLLANDGQDLSIRRRNADVQSRVEFEVTGYTEITTPQSFEFVLDSAVFARSNVIQSISLMNYQSGALEQVDSRTARRFADLTVTVTPAGDLTRFIEPTTGMLEAVVRYQSANQRQRFTANVDQVIWRIE